MKVVKLSKWSNPSSISKKLRICLAEKDSSWVELKGYLDAKSMTKIKRFKRYYESEFNKFTFIISKYSTDGKNFAAELEIPRVIFYEDIRSFYSDKISIWEGK